MEGSWRLGNGKVVLIRDLDEVRIEARNLQCCCELIWQIKEVDYKVDKNSLFHNQFSDKNDTYANVYLSTSWFYFRYIDLCPSEQ